MTCQRSYEDKCVSTTKDKRTEKLRPVITVSDWRGISTSIFFKLCTRAPYTLIFSPALFMGSFVVRIFKVATKQIDVFADVVSLAVRAFRLTEQEIDTLFHRGTVMGTIPTVG